MRCDIASVYQSTTWENKVKRMPDSQVIAIYNRMMREGKFTEVRKNEKQYGRQLKMEGV